jgi:hypothetical protein
LCLLLVLSDVAPLPFQVGELIVHFYEFGFHDMLMTANKDVDVVGGSGGQ